MFKKTTTHLTTTSISWKEIVNSGRTLRARWLRVRYSALDSKAARWRLRAPICLLTFTKALLVILGVSGLANTGLLAQSGTLSQATRELEKLDKAGKRTAGSALIKSALASIDKNTPPKVIAEFRQAQLSHFKRYELRDSLEVYADILINYAQQHDLSEIEIEAILTKSGHYLETMRYAAAMELAETAIATARAFGNQRLVGRAILQKGKVLRTSKNSVSAPLPYFYQAKEMLAEAGDTSGVIACGLFIVSGEEDMEVKMAMLQETMVLVDASGDRYQKIRASLFHAALLPPEEALPILQEALEYSQQLSIPNLEQHLYIQMTSRYQNLGLYDEALAAMDSALAAFPGNLPDGGSLNYYEIYRDKGDYKAAIEQMEKFRAWEDIRQKDDMKSLISQWETRLKTQEAEVALQEQQQANKIQQQRTILLIICLVFAAAMGVAIWVGYVRQRRRRQQLAEQNKVIRQQAEELQQLEALKSRFFANVSHELRTPLALMIGPIKRLRKTAGLQGENREMLTYLERNTLRLRKLVNEILDLSKLEDNKLRLDKAPVQFSAYLKRHLKHFYSLRSDETVQVSSEIDLPETVIMLDQSKFEKIIDNLLSNALKFTPPDGQVVFTAKEEEGAFCFSVRDTGRGIAAQDLPYIFDRFYQSRDESASLEGGTGIGLAMSNELAKLMGGEIWVESVVGEGSTFYFRLPIEVSDISLHQQNEAVPGLPLGAGEDAGAVIITEQQHTPVTTEKHILIVEDNADLRGYYKILLSDYRVSLTENGQEALAFLATGKLPDLIISDLMMPVMDGMELLGRLKSDDRYRHLPVIMLTAKTNLQVKLKALRFGIDDYLNKPFDDEELLVRTRNILTRQADRISFLQDEPDSIKSPELGVTDLNWLAEAEAFILARLTDKDLSVRLLGRHFSMSESTLLRQVKRLTGLTPNKYLQELRLNQAREIILTDPEVNISTVGYRVGFQDPAAFSRSFRKRFGKTPSKIRQ